MKIVFVNKPYQDENTIEPQLIDGEVFYWICDSETLKYGESFKEWIDRKSEYIVNHPKGGLVCGIAVYDIQIIGPASNDPTHFRLTVRYDWIKNKIS